MPSSIHWKNAEMSACLYESKAFWESMDYRTHFSRWPSVKVMKHFQCNQLGCKHLHVHAATFTSVNHCPITRHYLRNSDFIGFAALYIFFFLFLKQQRHHNTNQHMAAPSSLIPVRDDGRSTSTQQPLTISSLSDSDETWLTETAQVIEVSTAAIYQAICEHKDDKLFRCSNQFSAISGCHMSHGWNRAMSSLVWSSKQQN